MKISWLSIYFRSILGRILPLILYTGVFVLVFYLYNVPAETVLFAALICLVCELILLAVGFYRFSAKHHDLLRISDEIISSLTDMPAPSSAIEEDYQRIIESLYRSRQELLTEAERSRSDLADYYAMWVHQVKVPIQAMRLLLEDADKNSPLALELFRIEQYVNMALSYARIDSDYTDYVFKPYELDEIVRSAVRKYAPMFIAKKIALECHDTGLTVLTDSKWLQFVIEQILSNSLKYTKRGSIKIFSDSPSSLTIQDTGIGIAPEDINRVTQRGFTGYNGRIDKKSTGLGLYLSTKILSKLSHELSIESEVGVGTSVIITFNTNTILDE